MRFSYPPSARLRSGWEFDLLFRTGRRAQGRLVRLLFLDRGEGGARFGLVVGKRQGGAVVRNHGRRLLREAVRHVRPLVRDGLWIVVSLKNDALRAPVPEIFDDLRSLLGRGGLLREEVPRYRWDDVVPKSVPVGGSP